MSDDELDKESRTPPGVRELKLWIPNALQKLCSRTPPGVRELKHLLQLDGKVAVKSHPSRGA